MKRTLCLVSLCLGLILACLPIEAEETPVYQLGSQVADFALTTSEGEEVSLYGLLEDHSAVLINFCFADCGPCRYELPAMNSAWQELGDQVAFLAVTPFDDDEEIQRFRTALELSLPMARDTAGITDRFAIYGFPTNVLIDRSGVVCYCRPGALSNADAFIRLLSLYTAEDYDGPLLLSAVPPVALPAAPDVSALNAALNAPGSNLIFTTPEEAWPWYVSSDGRFALASNTGFNSSSAVVRTALVAQEGDALSFRFRTSTEEGYDLFSVYVDQQLVKVFSGENRWQRRAIPLEEGAHIISFAYSKNDLYAEGQDTVQLCDVELLGGEKAQKALERNPAYPLTLTGYEASADFTDPNAREIVFSDPDGALEDYYGADAYYILSEEEPSALVRLGDACDPDAAFVRSIDGTALSLSHCESAQEGFLVPLSPADPDLGWNALLLFPSILQPSGVNNRVYLYFASEEAVEDFCLYQVPDPETGLPVEGVTWEYADGL